MAAYAVPLCILPSATWRVVSTFPQGYPLILSGLTLGLGLLTLGLVHSWGERIPRWVPVLGGRQVPRMVAIIPAVLGAAGLIALIVTGVYNWFTLDVIPAERAVGGDRRPLSQRPEAGEVVWAYSPMAAWPLLVLAVTYAYFRRRSDESGEA